MNSALRLQTEKLYTRHAAAVDRGGWSLVSDVRWGDIDSARARSQQDVLARVRWAALELSARGARTARMLNRLAGEPHASAALTLDLWDGLKHFHALRSYLDTVDFTPRITDEELAAVRLPADEDMESRSEAALLLEVLLIQHLAGTRLRYVGSVSDEPVLSELAALMAGDEARHAQITTDLLRLRLREGLVTPANLLEETARFRRIRPGGEESAFNGDDLAMQTYFRRVEALCAEL
jgi:hypothetical protein